MGTNTVMTCPRSPWVTSAPGQLLTRRVWSLLRVVAFENDVTLHVVQGGYKAGHGATASADVHDHGDVYDLRVWNIPAGKVVPVCVSLRRRFGIAWPRTAAYGWSGDPHIHVVQADSYYELSAGAKRQVAEYRDDQDGLIGTRPDRLPNPPQHHYREDRLDMDPDAVYRAVWNQDRMKAPESSKDNPTWAPANVLRGAVLRGDLALERIKALEGDIAELTALVKALTAKVDAALPKS